MPFDAERKKRRTDADREKFNRELKVWLNDESSIIRELRDGFLFRWYFRKRKKFRWRKVPHQIVIMGLAASGPAIALWTANLTDEFVALAIFCSTLFLMFLTSTLSTWGRRRDGTLPDKMQLVWVQFGDLLNTVRSDATPAKDKNRSIDVTLSLMVSLAAQITELELNQISASLLLYGDENMASIGVAYRHRASSRPIRYDFENPEALLGHHSCEKDSNPRVVADFRRFGSFARKGSSQGNPKYRSLFIQPVLSRTEGRVRGFISIDCDIPHAFHSSRSDDLVVLIEPLKAHIEDVV